MRTYKRLFPILTFMVIALLALTTSCDRRNPPPTQVGITDPSEARVITKMVAAPDTIYADNNITYSEISVTIKDGEG
ncbi:MAG: hypothetical protein ACP5F3_06385, partial [Candidatus Syntrophosphaera sp.]